MAFRWTDRDAVQNTEQALEALADFLSTNTTIAAALKETVGDDSAADKLRQIYKAVDAPGGNYSDVARVIAHVRVNSQLDAAEAFAAQWKIPWNRALAVQIFAQLEWKHKGYEGRWFRSSADC